MTESFIDADEDGIVLTYRFRLLSNEKKQALLQAWREYIDLELIQIKVIKKESSDKDIYCIGNINHKIDKYGRVFMFINRTWVRSSKTAAEVKRGTIPRGAL